MNERKKHLIQYYEKQLRPDGRKLGEYREVSVEYGASETAEGSARVRIGGTEVIAGVKLGLERPYPDRPNEGNLMVNAELLAMSNPEFEPGPPSMFGVELARVIDRGIRESKAIDVKQLCVEPGEKAWSVLIDICTMNDEGNLLDAAGLAAVAALQDAVFPAMNEDGTVDYDTKTDKKLPIVRAPIPVTVLKVGDHFIVDPLPMEEEFAGARLTVAVTEKDTIAALQKGGEVPLTIDQVDEIAKMAIEKAKELRKKL